MRNLHIWSDSLLFLFYHKDGDVFHYWCWSGYCIELGSVRLLSQQPRTEVATIFAATREQPSLAHQELIFLSNGRVVNTELEATSQSSIDRAMANFGPLFFGLVVVYIGLAVL